MRGHGSSSRGSVAGVTCLALVVAAALLVAPGAHGNGGGVSCSAVDDEAVFDAYVSELRGYERLQRRISKAGEGLDGETDPSAAGPVVAEIRDDLGKLGGVLARSSRRLRRTEPCSRTARRARRLGLESHRIERRGLREVRAALQAAIDVNLMTDPSIDRRAKRGSRLIKRGIALDKRALKLFIRLAVQDGTDGRPKGDSHAERGEEVLRALGG